MTFEERMECVMRSIESHDRQIGELVDGLAELKEGLMHLKVSVETLVKVSNRDAVDILKLANIAESHERRIDDLEHGNG